MASVFEKARRARCLLAEIAEELEPGALDVAGAKELVDVFTQCERFSVANRGRVALRVDDGMTWKSSEHPSGAHWLAEATGESVGAAARALETARRLEDLPETADAFRAGELSQAEAAEIADAASLDPGSEHRLLETVRSSAAGDWWYLPAETPHRLVSTRPGTSWLAVRSAQP